MKASALLFVFSFTLSTVASASEHPCSEFFEKEMRAQEQVSEFDKEVYKLQKKLESIEERIARKMEETAPLRTQRESVALQLKNLRQEQSELQQNLRFNEDRFSAVEGEARHMSARIAWLREEIRRNPGPASRPYLREANELETRLPHVEAQLPKLRQAVAESRARLVVVPARINTLDAQFAQLDAALEESTRSLTPLYEVRSRAQQELDNTTPMFDDLQRKLAKARKHVQMCVGYEELSVKYPKALEVARDVYKQKCRNYVLLKFPTEQENQAQQEVLQSVCAQ